MIFIPKVTYNSGTVLTLSIPQRLWRPRSYGEGGHDISAAGIPESFKKRRDQLVRVLLRFTEAEWPSVLTWLEWAQDNSASFSFQFDKDDALTSYTVYLHSPVMGEDIEPQRGEAAGTYDLEVVLRSTNGTRFDVRLFA